MSPDTHLRPDLLHRIRGEYNEMPGLRLTRRQAQRLWGLEAAACEAVLRALVNAKFLYETREGAFLRREGLAA